VDVVADAVEVPVDGLAAALAVERGAEIPRAVLINLIGVCGLVHEVYDLLLQFRIETAQDDFIVGAARDAAEVELRGRSSCFLSGFCQPV